MAKVTVNKCPFTGLLFEDDKEYRRHQRKVRLHRKMDEERFQFAQQFDTWIQELYQQPTFDDIEAWINTNYHLLGRHVGYRCNHWYRVGDKYRLPAPDDYSTIEFKYMTFEELSTSSRAPIGQKTTGWGREDGYREHHQYKEFGWNGRIIIKHFGRGYEFFQSDILRAVGIHTGSGGGAPFESKYDVTLFAKDFRKMAAPEVFKKMAQV